MVTQAPRPTGTLDWQQALSCREDLIALSEACRREDGCRNYDEALLAEALSGRGESWFDREGRACLLLSNRNGAGRLELLLHPQWRGRGWGTSLIDSGLRRLQALGSEEVLTWAYGDRSRSLSFLAKFGFKPQRTLFQLRRAAAPCQKPNWPSGFLLRSFQEGDEEAWRALHLRLQADPRRAWSLQALREQLQQADTPPESFKLLWEGEILRGYLWMKIGEVFLFAVDPERRGQGLGTQLLREAVGDGEQELQVYCDDTREAALSLYRKFHFQEVTRDRCLSLKFPTS